MDEPQHRLVVRAPLSADVLEPFASGDGSLDVARVVDEETHYALFVLVGTLDESTAPQTLEHLVAAARLPAVDLVIVDLLRVAYLGAPGAACLEAASRAAARHDATFVVCRPSHFVRRVLEAAGLAGLIEHDTDWPDLPGPASGWRWE
ncbi:STAS domain-containing protein [Cryptosporangium aurantiacum]|uniref:Anti-anti-sigma factor n=1 Tax=Cryptosporangium aurantiacum TaxID=134849 RepID=A0A1M7RFM1_9ACTN|nr:STAS domain-containing protein [Cryptosporangium aurantiacum]SHN45077.1 anti-anti-sigma factor [Cryptosporangium aurantiacum]